MPRLPAIDNSEAIKRSAQAFPDQPVTPIYLLQIATAADEAPPWWSPARDRYLDAFWPTEPYLAGAIYSVASRNASFRYELTGPDGDTWWAQQLLAQANFGQGWHDFIMKITTDYLCLDNGAFFEIIRPAKAKMFSDNSTYDAVRMPSPITGEPTWMPYDTQSGKFIEAIVDDDFKVVDSPLSLPIGIAHLDSMRCTRTGNPEYPVIYTDQEGRQHKLNWYQVVTLEEMPSPREEMHGIQHSAVDRCLRLSQILRDMLIYKHEKISGRFARAVHLTNADAQLLQDAIDQAKVDADDRALQRYMQPIIISTVDPTAKPEVATIPLASLPDGFSEEETMRWYIAGIANALGVDYGFLSPLPGNKLGTSNQAETQERQARGKSSRLFMQLVTNKLNYSGILPRTVEFQFAVSDPWEESEQDAAFARRSRGYQTLIQSGLLPEWVVRQMAADKGDIDARYLEMMGEVDLTPIITISGTDVRRAHRRRRPVESPEQAQLPGLEEEETETEQKPSVQVGAGEDGR